MSVWTKLTRFSDASRYMSQPTLIDRHTFIIWSSKAPNKIQKYNIIDDRWDTSMTFPADCDFPLETIYQIGVTLAFDQNTCTLYVCAGHKIMIWNITENTYKIYNNTSQIGRGAYGLMANNKCHFVGGLCNNKHLIWSDEHKKLEVQHTFNDFILNMDLRLIYLKSKQIMYCIGGNTNLGRTDNIYVFDMNDMKWTKLEHILPKPLYHFGCVASRDNKYIIILGGINTSAIYVWNMQTMMFKRCEFDCPVAGNFHAINMNDANTEELLNCGYIRNLWQLPQFSDIIYPPFYLVQLIANYLSLEMIHLLDENGGHWKINIDAIL